MRTRMITAAACCLVLTLSACGGQGDASSADGSWEPTSDVVLSVPFAPGGGTDTMARAIADGLQEVRPGLKIAVENRPGGTGATGYNWVKQREGDPHVLTTIEGSILVLSEVADLPLSHDDFTMIGTAADYFGVVVTQAGSFDNLRELLDEAANETLTIGTTGPQDLWALAAAGLGQAEGAEFRPVPFESAGEAVGALVSGDVDMAIAAPEISIEFIKSGDLDALAVLSDERLKTPPFQSVPTTKELGIDFSFTLPKGLAAAGGITDAQREYWQEAFKDWTKTASYDKFIEQNLLLPNTRFGSAAEESMEQAEGVVADFSEFSK